MVSACSLTSGSTRAVTLEVLVAMQSTTFLSFSIAHCITYCNTNAWRLGFICCPEKSAVFCGKISRNRGLQRFKTDLLQIRRAFAVVDQIERRCAGQRVVEVIAASLPCTTSGAYKSVTPGRVWGSCSAEHITPSYRQSLRSSSGADQPT